MAEGREEYKNMVSPDVEWRLDADSKVGVVFLRRPPNNYLTVFALRNLCDVLDLLDQNPECRATILTSEGKHFCAGRDFSAERSVEDTSINVYREARRLMVLQKPWIALVNGGAIGAGLGLALAADFRICLGRSYFWANFVQHGLHQGFGLSVTLPHVVGDQVAAEMLLTGRRIGAREALDIGLVRRIVDDDSALDDAIEFAKGMAAHPEPAVREIRKTLRGDLAERFAAAVEREAALQSTLRATVSD